MLLRHAVLRAAVPASLDPSRSQEGETAGLFDMIHSRRSTKHAVLFPRLLRLSISMSWRTPTAVGGAFGYLALGSVTRHEVLTLKVKDTPGLLALMG